MPSPDEVLVVYSTFPSPDKAAEVARVLVEEQLVACVNIIPTVRSIYRWQANVQDDSESLAILKTSRDRFPDLARRLVQLHPYELPEVIALPLAAGHPPYLAWVVGSVG
ncbi:MAG: divalent-cation tolerance protein CutA [Deltaproteobacteria bacterium]|nr:divalent-cation tolerance protein CutA [Deltaproteobacteria bacterium]